MLDVPRISLLALTLVGCSQSEPFDPAEHLQWPAYTFSEAAAPLVASPPARDRWGTVALPLELTGQDNGDQSILYSLALAHYWLVKTQLPSGDYAAEWRADTDERAGPLGNLRSFSVGWSQVLLYRFLRRDAHLIAAYRVARKYLGELSTGTLADGTPMQSIGGRLNASALCLFLLVELEDVLQQGEFAPHIEQLANYIAAQVDDDGCIYTGYPHGDACRSVHDPFAVGQGMVALERLYRYTGDERWLDLLQRAARYYEALNEGAADPDGGFYWSAWAGPPMVALVLERPDPQLERWIYAQADRWVSDQYTPGADRAYVGGFKKLAGHAPSWSASSEVEIIVDAYRLAEARGDTRRMASYKASGILAAKFMMGLQYRKHDVDGLGLADPERAIGAFHFSNHEKASSIGMHNVRSDYMGHFAVTLLKTVAYLGLPERYPGDGFAEVRR